MTAGDAALERKHKGLRVTAGDAALERKHEDVSQIPSYEIGLHKKMKYAVQNLVGSQSSSSSSSSSSSLVRASSAVVSESFSASEVMIVKCTQVQSIAPTMENV